MRRVSVALYFFGIFGNSFIFGNQIPIVLSTWNFDKAVAKAWKTLVSTDSALDSIEAGCTTCENLQCDGTVGYGGSPDENGETTLDAMIMDGTTMDVGAVLSLRRIKHVNSVARAVLEHSTHSILAGDLATKFAKQMGFLEETLSTNVSKNMWTNWQQDNCQPNFWKNVEPNPREFCGPYTPIKSDDKDINNLNTFNSKNHDTIGIIAIDSKANIASGTSTNGARHKIPGRVGDSPIPGSGSYADSSVGAAAATGDGDILLRFLPSFLAVEEMRRGSTPSEATAEAVKRISRFYPKFSGAVVAVNKNGEYSAACHGMDTFPYTVRSKTMNREEILWIPCTNENDVPEIEFV